MSWLDPLFRKGYVTVQVGGVAVPNEAILNFSSGATVTDDSSNARTNVSLSAFGTHSTETLTTVHFDYTGDAKGVVSTNGPVHVQTTDATVTTIDSFTIPSNTTLIVSAMITAVKSDSSQGASYLRTAAFRNNGGTVAQISTTQDGGTFEDDATWDATIDNSTTTIRIRVTGKAATTIQWSSVIQYLRVTP